MSPDHVLLLEPRGACGGVEAAVQALAWLVLLEDRPVQCFHHVVHNDEVVERFERLGVTFVDDAQAVTPGATVLLSAHGTPPATRADIAERAGTVVDAICPLVAKVHREIGARAAAGDRVLYVGRAGHDETVGALAVAPEHVTLVASPADIEGLVAEPQQRVAVLAQTTLRVEEVEAAEAAARRAFGSVWTPARSDICDASSTRQAAVRAVAARAGLVLVVGSSSSSNTASLVSAALEAGAPRAVRISGVDDLPDDLAGTVAVTAGASTPHRVVDAVIERLDPHGRAEVVRVATERVQAFPVPATVRHLVQERLGAGELPGPLAALATNPATTADDLLDAAEARARVAVA